jgi:hypothetical protein
MSQNLHPGILQNQRLRPPQAEARRLEVPIQRRIASYSITGLLVTSCVALASCGGGDDASALEWSFFKQLGPRKAKLAGEVGYCVGDPKPRVERVIRRYSGNRVFLTLILSPEGPKAEECLGVGLGVFKTVSFQRDLDQLILLDSSTGSTSSSLAN